LKAVFLSRCDGWSVGNLGLPDIEVSGALGVEMMYGNAERWFAGVFHVVYEPSGSLACSVVRETKCEFTVVSGRNLGRRQTGQEDQNK
jgi:hypothetical protein